MRIDKYESEVAIRDLACQLVEECESLIAEMVDSKVICPDADVVEHWEWREEKGVPHFRATIHYKPLPEQDSNLEPSG